MNTEIVFAGTLLRDKALDKAVHKAVKAGLEKKQKQFEQKMSKHPEAVREQQHYSHNRAEYRRRQKRHIREMLKKYPKNGTAGFRQFPEISGIRS